MDEKRSNWAKQYEEKQENWEERQRKQQLRNCDNQLEQAKERITIEEKRIVQWLERKVKIYHAMQKEGIEFDQQDYLATCEELADRRYSRLQEEHGQDPEEISWTEYREEEQMEDAKEERE